MLHIATAQQNVMKQRPNCIVKPPLSLYAAKKVEKTTFNYAYQ